MTRSAGTYEFTEFGRAAWRVEHIDLWKLLKKPSRITDMRLETKGSAIAFDQLLLGRTQEDLQKAMGK